MARAMDIDLISPDFKANPYPVFSWLRSNAPIYQMTMKSGRQVWIVSRYEDAETALMDPRLVRDERNALPPEEIARQAGWQTAQTFLGRHMLTSDPPVHTRLRSLVSASFALRSVEQWRGRIQAISDELLDAVQVRGEMDLIGEFGALWPRS